VRRAIVSILIREFAICNWVIGLCGNYLKIIFLGTLSAFVGTAEPIYTFF
jgi:hypothetical protein